MARNISAGGILIEMPDPMPLGTAVRVHFFMPDSQATIIARGEVKNHYFLNFNDAERTALADRHGDQVLGVRSRARRRCSASALTRMRILH